MVSVSRPLLLALLAGCRPDQADQNAIPPLATEGHATTPDSVGLYYRVVGRGSTTVLAPFALFHGTALDALAPEFRVVTYDPRGRGQSDPVPMEKISLDHLLIDFETVRRAVNAEQVAIIGWSGGGMEMFVYALRNPGRVSRLVHLAPVAPRLNPYGGAMMADRAARTDSVAAARLRERIAAGVYSADSAGWCRAADSVSAPALFAQPASRPATPDVCRFPNEYPDRLDQYFGALFRSIDGFDWRDSLPAVTIPRLVIHGAKDNTPLAGNLEWVVGQPNARILVIEGAGHWPHYEQPRASLAALVSFLRGGWPDGSVAR